MGGMGSGSENRRGGAVTSKKWWVHNLRACMDDKERVDLWEVTCNGEMQV